MGYKKLGFLDDGFLLLESRRQPLHIGVMMLFELPANAEKDFISKLVERLRESTRAAPPFNYRLVNRGGHFWEEADDFDLAQHFVHTSLPQPGRYRELFALVSRVHCAHLDRAYPLWRMYLIEGLEDGRIAVYLKIHHAMVDGVGGMRLLMKSMSSLVEVSVRMPPPWEVETVKSDLQPLPLPTPVGGVPALRVLSREGIKSLWPLVREFGSTYRDLRNHNENLTLAGQAPACIFNVKVSATRRFAAQSYASDRLRAVALAHDATLNDVALAMCSGALRRYLAELGELPERSLTAGVAVSLRGRGSEAKTRAKAANEIAFTLTSLATDIDDPAQRLIAIKHGMDYNKERLNRLSAGQFLAHAALMMLQGTLTNMLKRNKDRALGSVVISHVPGPRRDVYWQGMRLCGMYPASLLIDGAALNITLVSRHDYVDFGLIACRKAVPQMQRLLDYLEEALVELENLVKQQTKTTVEAGKPVSRRKVAKSKSKTSRASRSAK